MEISGVGQLDNVNMEVLGDTVGSHQQTVDGKAPKTNGTMISALNEIVNPNIGSTYLYLKAIEEALGVMEQHSKVIKDPNRIPQG